MNIKFKTTWTALIATLSLALSGLAMAATGVGEVIFTVGEVKVQGSNAPLKRGDALAVGQTLMTGSNGHIHIRFIDQAFVSVRPGSELRIEQYLYDQAEPANNRIKFSLVKGTSRLITGKAGQANKQGFRLNTPVAAIGIRGTDFVVQVGDDVARVAVQQGGVTVSPFNQDCITQAFGACGGTQARELSGSLTDAFLEVKSQGATQLVQGQGRKSFALPRPEEPGVKTNDGAKTTAALPSGMNGTQQLIWGRWSSGSVTPSGYELIGQNDAFVLYRSLDQITLPANGYVNFQIKDVQAFGREGRGSYEDASISKASLSVNFEKMLYTTKFDWQFNNNKATLYSRGNVSETGRLTADRNNSNMSISGALGSSGEDAAYLFSKKLGNDINAYGLIHWQK
jgi:hypothetical protein